MVAEGGARGLGHSTGHSTGHITGQGTWKLVLYEIEVEVFVPRMCSATPVRTHSLLSVVSV